ncbi:MAG: undecaprenyl-diphosphate phosphatase [Candidatus Omnitrophica bacterium]|nr:undecaprenyl-diphosphate phosphatase [Candidatus Omnitrophota bacterium]MDD4940550.1 undecaprenyl-diphosphate phosphatase [Candidatus Omnitrophota bacterium]MDD5774845.1 undecaprenyl-diphosphate phosphatase [Candidatus Omnitrophota bacterium]HNQ50440.1 undecaprenyl-diphosphate phosphatase [Candidatus Omnitrophota bacterium]HQO37416.1 undecaprenyl-diphosphate phosphatase [Candidatus Omnitrophota bacterium]
MIEYIILGIVQGLTEFLPVSSSGHLAVLERLFGLSEQGVAISIVMHVGTLGAVFVFFRRDMLAAMRNRRMILFIFIVTCITGVIGVLGKDLFESIFASVKAVAAGWIVTGTILLLTKRRMHNTRAAVNNRDASILGITQGIAIIPGISRSGITIATMLYLGVEKIKAFSISFLASIPAIAGAAFLEAKDIGFVLSGDPVPLAAGFLCSFGAGLFALWLLKRVLVQAKFHYFAYYCYALAVITLVWVR